MTAALALGGWLVALTLGVAAVRSRLSNAARAESVARASHELRGALHAAGLVLHHGAAGEGSALALQLELDKAALAVADLVAPAPLRRDRHFDLAALIERQSACWTALAAAAGRELHVGSPGAPLMSVGDPVRVAQVLGNLVANALEHGAGRVDVKAWALGAEAIVVEVADQGGGLPAAVEVLVALPRRGRGRRGRGLAIASGIVSGLGGRLSAEPTATGSRLVVELPAWVS